MPATILTSLMLWSTFLLPGATVDQFRDLPSSVYSDHSTTILPVELTTIQAWPIDNAAPWTLSEANSEEEEESTDNDDNVIVAEHCWSLPRTGLLGSSSIIRLDPGFAYSPLRSIILRC
jgi:hypothetical protein